MSNEVFLAYSDESGIFEQRYQAIGIVSGPDDELAQLRTALKNILDKENVSELKFVNIRRSKGKTMKAAQRFLTCAIREFAIQTRLRIDVITWGDENSLEVIQSNNRIAKLEDMYHRVLTHIGRQWRQINWNFYPDVNSQIHWNQIISFLNRTSLVRFKPRLLQLFENNDPNQSFKFSNVKELSSSCEPLIQLADLFAGMARFSREKGEQCVQWLNSWGSKAQLRFLELLKNGYSESDTTRTNRARFELIGKFDKLCKRYKMRVSLKTNKCLWTFDPTYPINFWNC
jgi:hypothetical protein